MINFFQAHLGEIITTLIGIVSSIYFYYVAKRDGDKTAREYKAYHQRAEKEIARLESRLAEITSFAEKHLNVTLSQEVHLGDLAEQLSSRNGTNLEAEEIYVEFMALLGQHRIKEAENYLIGKRSVLQSAIIYDFLDAHLKTAQGKFEEAIRLLDGVTEIDNGDVAISRAYGMKAIIYHTNLRDYQKALIEYQWALQTHSSVEYHTGLADCYLYLKEYTLAKKSLDAAVKCDGEHDFLWLVFAKYYHETSNYDLALEYIEKAYLAGRVTPALFVTKALILEAKGENNAALESYTRAKKLKPDHKSAIYNSANLYIKLGNFPQADIELSNFRRLFPNELFVLGSYFYVLSVTDRDKRIIEIGERLKIAENVTQCHEAVNTLGICYLKIDEMNKAKLCFENLLAVYPNYLPAFTGLFYLYLNLKSRDLKLAEYYCQKEEQAGLSRVSLLEHKALIKAVKKDFKSAIKLLDEAIKIDPDHILTKESRAGILEFERAYLSELDLSKREAMEMPIHIVKLSNPLNGEEQESFVK